MTHDIDYPIHGPGKAHILQRKHRFSPDILQQVEQGHNPYYGIPELIALEEKYGVRSTFFFRPTYDDNSTAYDSYREVMRELVKGGWEVGVHINEASRLSAINNEKAAIENAANARVQGSRVHYLRIQDPAILEHANIKYDSSVCFNKYALDWRNFGSYQATDNLTVFPITLMDAYMFTYMRVPEYFIVDVVKEAVAMAERTEKKLMTILWHDSCLKMYGGRAYKDVLAYLAENTEIVRGIDALEMVKSQKVSA